MIRILGSGRAARAQLVDAQMPDGSIVRCVEKVFAPGRLTRWIYRAAFAAPFAYQTNRNAILASFYRRRVADAVMATSDIGVEVASPMYVRYCAESKAWVLAAEWIDGRGIRPLPAHRSRFREWLGKSKSEEQTAEIDQLVACMKATEDRLSESGLTGSGWQVAPRAMVSTANLLRRNGRYTIVDLESGIPAVLVPKYIAAGLRCATAPPFDDLDPNRLRDWLAQNEELLTFRLGIDPAAQVVRDVEQLIQHTEKWKAAEIAPLRRPWRLLRPGGLNEYQFATVKNWRQTDIIDQRCESELKESSRKGRAIWWALFIPSMVGLFVAKLIGRQQTRNNAKRWLSNPLYRRVVWHGHLDKSQRRWTDQGRIAEAAMMTAGRYTIHRPLSLLPSRIHRFLTDTNRRKHIATSCLLFLLSGRYQAWLGQTQIDRAIDRWVGAKRISADEGGSLRNDLSGNEIRVYSRGFGMHVALKFLAPILIPAKIGSVMAFVANGNAWFLVPLAATPILRVMVSIGNWIQSRGEHVRHREALAVSGLPFVGSIAFPLQMYASRPELATFLIRDAASRVGCKLPIYGGSDSRTELACIRAADFIIEALDVASGLTGATTTVAGPRLYKIEASSAARTRFGRWLDDRADERIKVGDTDSESAKRIAA